MENAKLISFIMVLGLISPVMSFGMTAFGGSPSTWDLTLDKDTLTEAGINLGDVEAHNVTFQGGWVNFNNLNDTRRRVQWTANVLFGNGYFVIQKRSPLEAWLNLWLSGVTLNWINPSNGEVWQVVYNSTIVNAFTSRYNWSHFTDEYGMHVFFTPHPTAANITDSVYNVGIVTVTIGTQLQQDETLNFKHFLAWYSNMIMGENVFGLPPVLFWIQRILTAMGFLSFVFLLKGLTQL